MLTRPCITRLWTRFKLGLFDPPDKNPYSKIGMDQNDTPEHRALALKLAEESIVLLKNDGILPLDRSKIKRIAVIGPNANATDVLHGNYNGDASHPITILSGIRQLAGPNIEVTYAQGSPITTETGRGFGGRGGGGFGGPLTADQTAQLDNAIAPAQTNFTSLQDQLTAAQKDVVTAVLAKSDDNTVRAKLEAVAKIQMDIAVLRYTKGVHAIAASVTAEQKTAINAAPAPAYDTFFIAAAAAPGRGGGRGGFGGRGAAPTRPPAELQAEAISNAVELPTSSFMSAASLPRRKASSTTAPASSCRRCRRILCRRFTRPASRWSWSIAAVRTWRSRGRPNICPRFFRRGIRASQAGRPWAKSSLATSIPSGHLTVTFYRATTDLPAFTNYAMADRTYRYYEGKPLYAFGHGLSYTKFDFQERQAGVEHDGRQRHGESDVHGEKHRQSGRRRSGAGVFPPCQLGGPAAETGVVRFHPRACETGRIHEVTVEVPAERLRYWDTEKKQYVVEPGKYEFLVGAASDDIRLTVADDGHRQLINRDQRKIDSRSRQNSRGAAAAGRVRHEAAPGLLPMKTTLLSISAFMLLGATAQAAEVKVSSPDGKAVITVTDAGGLSYTVFLDGREVVSKSRFGIISDGVDLGADAKLGKSSSHRIREIVFHVWRPFARLKIIAAKPPSPSAAAVANLMNSTCAPTTTAWRCARGWRPRRAGESTAKRRNGKWPAIRWRGSRRTLSITREFSRAAR